MAGLSCDGPNNGDTMLVILPIPGKPHNLEPATHDKMLASERHAHSSYRHSQARLRAFQATGGPAALWPRVTPHVSITSHARIAAVTRAVLNGERASLQATDGADVTALGVNAFVSGMGGLLGH